MRTNHLSIHSENILPIIKKWLYSDKDIFLRELVSNATDALNKVKILYQAQSSSVNLTSRGIGEQNFSISIQIDKSNKTLSITDTGIGMTEEEVEKYIAQIAFSGAEEFAKKYKSQTEKDPIIGHFGLGFYSAYMVATKVEIDTLSYLPSAKPVFWSCDGTTDYTIGPGTRTTRGTQITLFLDEVNLEYLEEAKLRTLLHRYCQFMPFPISLNGKEMGNEAPLWMQSPSECTEQDYTSFYRKLFPLDPAPLFWVHLNIDYPFHLQGILYFPKIHRRFDSETSTIRLFCNRVFVSDNCKDILPDYLTILRGAIDSPDIPLNVSRSYLQVDQNVRQLSNHISKKIADRLATLYKTDRATFISVWPDVEMIVKLGILQDEKFFEKAKEFLIWKNTAGEWTTLTDYLERTKEKKIYYTHTENPTLLAHYKEKTIEVLLAPLPLDTPVIQALEEKLSTPFQRIDSALHATLLDPTREKTLLDADGKTAASRIATFIQSALDQKELDVEAKSLASDTLPALLIVDENQRRMRDYLALTQQTATPLSTRKTFVVNTNHPLVQTIARIQTQKPDLATSLVKSLYDLSLLSQKELDPQTLTTFVSHQTQILEKLASLIT